MRNKKQKFKERSSTSKSYKEYIRKMNLICAFIFLIFGISLLNPYKSGWSAYYRTGDRIFTPSGDYFLYYPMGILLITGSLYYKKSIRSSTDTYLLKWEWGVNRDVNMRLFNSIIKDIKNEYSRNPNNLGWRFLATSKNILEKNNGITLITLNPGGSVDRKDYSSESCEKGCAYLSEIWGGGTAPGESKLQKQFQLLFVEIADQLNADGYKEVMESSLCGYFIPFRSPDIKSLKDKNRCIEFSKKNGERF